MSNPVTSFVSGCFSTLSAKASSAKETLTVYFSKFGKKVQTSETQQKPVVAQQNMHKAAPENSSTALNDRKTEKTHYCWNTLIGCSLGTLFGECAGAATGGIIGALFGSLLGPVTAATGLLIGSTIGGFSGGLFGAGIGTSEAYRLTERQQLKQQIADLKRANQTAG